MIDWWHLKEALRLGLLLGLIFGAVNLVFSWLYPLGDDTNAALLRFYGPMFFLWAFAAFRAERRNRQWLSGVATGLVVALATFCMFDVLNLVRVNLFLYDLTGRADWQSMMARFRASEFDSVRAFVTMDYIKDAPLKIGTASVIGALMGGIGGLLGRLRSWFAPATA